MILSQVERIVAEAIQKKLVVRVEYVRKQDEEWTCRMVEPFDVAPPKKSKTGDMKFWGWCRYHDKMEQRKIENIVSIRITEEHFDPKVRERTFSSPPRYRIPRKW